MSVNLPISARLNEHTALQLAADLAQVETENGLEVVLDFGKTAHYEPFGMLYAASAIRRLQHRASFSGAKVSVLLPSDAEEGLAGHMGFWHSINYPVGRAVGASAGKSSYVPITKIEVQDLYRAAGGTDPCGAGIVEREAGKLARVLANPYSEALCESLTYSLRELIRNVLEHAMTPVLWLAGMSWPKRDYVQVAILDEGRGVRQSLADNPEFRFETDIAAVREALKPGVTRNKGRIRSQQEIERWHDERHVLPLSVFDNMGYGLYMVSTFCREAGQFLLASGSTYLAFVSSAEVTGSTLHRGTAFRLVVEPTKVAPAFDRLFETLEARGGGENRKPLLSASTLRRLGLGSLVQQGQLGTADNPSRASSQELTDLFVED